MWRNLCEISCGQFPWKLKDENQRKNSPRFRRIFISLLESYGENFTRISLWGTMGITNRSDFKALRFQIATGLDLKSLAIWASKGSSDNLHLQWEILCQHSHKAVSVFWQHATTCPPPPPKKKIFKGRKNHDSHRRDRIRRDFLHWIVRYFLQILGGSSYQITQRTWRKSKKSSGEPPVETAPRNCRFLSLVLVERVLKIT